MEIRRIKLYEDFNSVKEINIEKIRSDIKDIFLELEDIGYVINLKVNVTGTPGEKVFNKPVVSYIKISILINNGNPGRWKSNTYINIDTVKEYLLMFEDYIKSLNREYDVSYSSKSDSGQTYDDLIDDFNNSDHMWIDIKSLIRI
jgi:hypothetical protein